MDIKNRVFNWSFEIDQPALKQLSHNYHRLKYSKGLVPQRAWPNPKIFRDTKANQLQDAVVAFFYLQSGMAERINSTGTFIPSKKGEGRMVYGSSMNGTSDVHGLIDSVSFRVEVKIGIDQLSEDQIKYKRLIEKCGGIFIEARSFEGFVISFFKAVEGLRNE